MIDDTRRETYDNASSTKVQKYVCSFGTDCGNLPEPPGNCPSKYCSNMVHNVCSSFWQCDGVCPSCKKNGPPPDPATLLRLEDGKSAIVVQIDRVRPLSDPPAAAAHVASPLSLRGGALSIGEGSDNEGDEGNRPNHQSTQTMAETPRESNDGSLEALHPGSQGTSRVSSIRWHGNVTDSIGMRNRT